MSWGRFKWSVIVIAIGVGGVIEDAKERRKYAEAAEAGKTIVVGAGDEFNPNKRWLAALMAAVGVVMFIVTARKRDDD